MNGAGLFALVERYHRFGDHRAGTTVDDVTVDWYADELSQRGLTVRREPVAFNRYDATSELTADGEPIEHLPLFYEWTGTVDTTNVDVISANANEGGRDHDLDRALDASAPDDQAIVIATEHPEGSLIAVNRAPHDHHGRPTVLVAGRDFARLDRADQIRLRMTAAIEPATTTNLIAHNPAAESTAPLVLTTPLTGWFGCAGERGCGVAVLLDLVDRFAHVPLLVVATGGHELEYHGAKAWVDGAPASPAAIAHIGASIAVDEPDGIGDRQLIRGRLAMTDPAGVVAENIGAALAPAGFHYRPATDRWLGESEVFCDLGVPMLSFTGSGLNFHTPEDTPSRSTSAASLQLVAEALASATDVLWRAVGSGSRQGDNEGQP